MNNQLFKAFILMASLCWPSLLVAEPIPTNNELHQLDIKRQLPPAQIRELPLQQNSFLSLHLENMTSYTRGTALLVPDWSEHAASPKHLNNLRQQLTDYGWHTLAIMPPMSPDVTALDETMSDYSQQLQQRMTAAMQLAGEQPGVIIVIAQGNSAAVLNQLYADSAIAAPAALIILGAYLPDMARNVELAKHIASHAVPTLDINHQEDNHFVRSTLPLRRKLADKHLKAIYRQRSVMGSGYQADTQQWVMKEIYGWLTSMGF